MELLTAKVKAGYSGTLAFVVCSSSAEKIEVKHDASYKLI